jgi:hypothetical protein
VRIQLLCDAKTGRVLAAIPAGAEIVGDDGPDSVVLVPREGEVRHEIELTADQASIDPVDLFVTHRVKKGELVVHKAKAR